MMVQCEGKILLKPSSYDEKPWDQPGRKLILIFLIFFTSLGENIFFYPDSGALLAPSMIAVSFGSDLETQPPLIFFSSNSAGVLDLGARKL